MAHPRGHHGARTPRPHVARVTVASHAPGPHLGTPSPVRRGRRVVGSSTRHHPATAAAAAAELGLFVDHFVWNSKKPCFLLRGALCELHLACKTQKHIAVHIIIEDIIVQGEMQQHYVNRFMHENYNHRTKLEFITSRKTHRESCAIFCCVILTCG